MQLPGGYCGPTRRSSSRPNGCAIRTPLNPSIRSGRNKANMSAIRTDWAALGFSREPTTRVSEGQGLLLYRCWGARTQQVGSTECGTGYFALEKPRSVLQAELRFNIVDWGNGVHFVSTFRLLPGYAYLVGSVAHGASDLTAQDSQVFVAQPLGVKLVLVRSQEVLRHDVSVAAYDGRA